jgi:hypothetical protein
MRPVHCLILLSCCVITLGPAAHPGWSQTHDAPPARYRMPPSEEGRAERRWSWLPRLPQLPAFPWSREKHAVETASPPDPAPADSHPTRPARVGRVSRAKTAAVPPAERPLREAHAFWSGNAAHPGKPADSLSPRDRPARTPHADDRIPVIDTTNTLRSPTHAAPLRTGSPPSDVAPAVYDDATEEPVRRAFAPLNPHPGERSSVLVDDHQRTLSAADSTAGGAEVPGTLPSATVTISDLPALPDLQSGEGVPAPFPAGRDLRPQIRRAPIVQPNGARRPAFSAAPVRASSAAPLPTRPAAIPSTPY